MVQIMCHTEKSIVRNPKGQIKFPEFGEILTFPGFLDFPGLWAPWVVHDAGISAPRAICSSFPWPSTITHGWYD